MLMYEKFIKKFKLLETINNPNLSIVVPGGCNAHCDFCFWKKTRVNENYFQQLKETINNLPQRSSNSKKINSQLKNEISLLKKLKKGNKVKCIKNFKDKFIIGEEYEFNDLELSNEKISIKYIKYKDKNNNIIKSKNINQFDSIIKVNVIFRMNITTFLEFFDIYRTIKPNIIDDEFEWDWED